VLQATIYKSPFKDRYKLLMEKSGQWARESGGNIATEHGVRFEDEALEKYMERTGEKALLFGLIPHPTIDWIGASPDAVTHSGRMVEIKVRVSIMCSLVGRHTVQWLFLRSRRGISSWHLVVVCRCRARRA